MYIEYIYVSHISFRKENHLCKAPLISTSSLTSSYPMSFTSQLYRLIFIPPRNVAIIEFLPER